MTMAPRASSARRTRQTGDSLVATLADQVEQLIRENRQLKRAVAKAEKAQGSAGGLRQAAKALSALQRRIGRALEGGSDGRSRRSAAAAAAPTRTRRKVTDPEVLERRRQALAKARAVRAAKREAAG
jgi:hypothetical protein